MPFRFRAYIIVFEDPLGSFAPGFAHAVMATSPASNNYKVALVGTSNAEDFALDELARTTLEHVIENAPTPISKEEIAIFQIKTPFMKNRDSPNLLEWAKSEIEDFETAQAEKVYHHDLTGFVFSE